jgi:hypothetical protein
MCHGVCCAVTAPLLYVDWDCVDWNYVYWNGVNAAAGSRPSPRGSPRDRRQHYSPSISYLKTQEWSMPSGTSVALP